MARTAWRTREGDPEGEFRLLNLLAKLQNLEIGLRNVDGHKCDLDQNSELNHKPIAWLGHKVTMEPSAKCEMPYKWACLAPRILPRALAMEGAGCRLLPQDAALYRKDKVIDECLEAVASISLEVFGGRAKRRMRALFNGIQIRRNRLKGVSQSS